MSICRGELASDHDREPKAGLRRSAGCFRPSKKTESQLKCLPQKSPSSSLAGIGRFGSDNGRSDLALRTAEFAPKQTLGINSAGFG